MFKNIYARLALISTISTLAVLIALPRIHFKIDNKYIHNLQAYVGGYVIDLFGGKVHFDFRSMKKGLDLAGGIKVVLKADMSQIPTADRDAAIESAKTVIERRVNLLGVSEPSVATLKTGGEYRILVEIPGVEDISEAVSLIGQTAQLKFKELRPGIIWDPATFAELQLDPDIWQDTNVTGADLKGAEVVVGATGDIQNGGRPQIKLLFTNEGRRKFSELAKNNIQEPIGLFLDDGGEPLSMPVVSADLAQGLTDDPVITGNFDFDSAKQLSIQIRAGALPIPVEVLQQETIGATLGNDSIASSLYAGIVGLILVFAFMVFKYGKLGLLSGISLTIYTAIVLAVFKLLGVVLTLPGVAGLILSIGMATDANILIFERMNEEMSWGKPRSLAIKLGFDRAWDSIRDSNMSSLITSFILFRSGDGPVRGFALTLAIGILISLFTSIFVVRAFIEIFNFGEQREPKSVDRSFGERSEPKSGEVSI
jgi:preprotein translocase subunit SecD